jgi:glutathione S-transferase
LWFGKTAIDEKEKAGLHEALSNIDTFLEGSPWVAGSSMTIADIVCVAPVSSMVVS